jgi:hypothetical protein
MTLRIVESGWTSFSDERHNRNLINVVHRGQIVGVDVHLLVKLPDELELKKGHVLYVDLVMENQQVSAQIWGRGYSMGERNRN